MEEKINMANLSREDELSVRKIYIEKILKDCKEQLENKVMLMLGKSFDSNIETKAHGQVIFLERWLEDIDKEMKSL